MTEAKEKAAGATNTNGSETLAIKQPNEKKSEEIISQDSKPVKKIVRKHRKLLSDPKFIELAHKWHEDKISLKEAAAILDVSWSTFQKNAASLLGKKQTKMKPARRAEPISISLKASAEYQEHRRRKPRLGDKEEAKAPYINPYVKEKPKQTCAHCKKEYQPEPTRYKCSYKDKIVYFCSWNCKCRFLRAMGKKI